MTRTCPSCGAINHGTIFCTSCKKPLRGSLSTPSGMIGTQFTRKEQFVVRAGFFRRLAAFAIDWLTLSIIADIVRFAYRIGSGTEPGMGHLDIALFLSTVLFLLYFTLLTGEGGQTLGKMLMGIRVQLTDGSPVGYRRAFLRTLGYTVSVFFMTFLGFLWALWDKKNQAWHDKIAGTEVIKI
ncbi:MAG: RDD family protein [bacterium]|nr:RDD family protein [bacterium]MDT8366404.1 RDD family protein [bacterium]